MAWDIFFFFNWGIIDNPFCIAPELRIVLTVLNGYKKKKKHRIYNRDYIWIANPKIFAICSFREKFTDPWDKPLHCPEDKRPSLNHLKKLQTVEHRCSTIQIIVS